MFKKFATGFVTGTLMLSLVVPSFADTTVDVSGNGSGSHNKVKVSETCSQTVSQTNQTNVSVGLTLVSNTGKNKANDNTGGDVTIDTGDAATAAVVAVAGGNNEASLPNCCCGENGTATDVTVSGNGTNSRNRVRIRKNNSTSASQDSQTNVGVSGYLKANTGKNKAKANTGGNVDVLTGNAETGAEVVVEAGHNTL